MDIHDWHPVRFSVQVADVTDAGLTAYFDALEQQIHRDHADGRRYVLVFDPRHGRPPNLEQRLVQARFIERVSPLVADINLGTALCTPSPLLRGMMAALFWVARGAHEQISLASMRACVDWACARVLAAGLELPPGLRDDPDGVLAEIESRALAARH